MHRSPNRQSGRMAAAISRTGWKEVSFAVDTLTHADLNYAPAENGDPEGDSDGTSITIANPMPLAGVSPPIQ